ncbi:MAG: hypothetical protein GXO37_02230 [Chloroflexi bacterium]|nr:hypothetical protein [Chloroflexota bacterium]
MRIVVLGGAGKMGSIAVQTLAQDARVHEVVLADYNLENARAVAEVIGSPKVQVSFVDVTDPEGLRAVLRGADACVNAVVYYFNMPIMEACLDEKVPYVDMGGLFHGTRKQLQLHDRYAAAGVAAVLGMGSAPGIPNVQARYAADRLDTLEYIRIYDGILPPPEDEVRFTYAVPTILDEMTLSPMVYRDGEFVEMPPLSEFEDYCFVEPLGVLPMHLSLHSEVATLPLSFQHKGVREVFFKINFWGLSRTAVEKLSVLAEFGLHKKEPVRTKRGVEVSPREVLEAVLEPYVPPVTAFLAPPTRKPPQWVKEIVTEVKGTKDGETVVYRLGTTTVKGALPTGAAPALTAIWLAQGRVPAGVYPPEQVIEPEPFFDELAALDILTTVGVTRPLKG